MSDDQFTRLFKYMEANFAQLREELAMVHAELKTDVNSLYNLLDQDIKQREIDEQERLALSHQVDKHDNWIHVLAKKTDTILAESS